jgi:hypothetical protein
VAVGLPGVERRALRRGDALVEPGAYVTSYRLDVVLDELEPIPHALRLRVHHGTAEIAARVVRAGTSPFAQLRLGSPAVAARHDRVVLRTLTTVGGGRVLDPAPPRHNDRGRFERAARGEVPRTDALTTARRQAPAPLPDRSADAARLEGALTEAGLGGIRIDDGELAAYLEREKRAVKLTDGFVIAVEAYEEARRLLLMEANREGAITLARFRDLLATSRRPAQRLLERLDTDRVTRRVGDERILRRAART